MWGKCDRRKGWHVARLPWLPLTNRKLCLSPHLLYGIYTSTNLSCGRENVTHSYHDITTVSFSADVFSAMCKNWQRCLCCKTSCFLKDECIRILFYQVLKIWLIFDERVKHWHFRGHLNLKVVHALVTCFFLWVTLWGVGEEPQFSVIFGQDYGVQLT